MEPKNPIVIDGVDVSGCEYFNSFRNIYHNKNLSCDCEKNPNCCYRQLKRKEKENERYGQTLIVTEDIVKADFNHTCWETYARPLKQILQKISEVK